MPQQAEPAILTPEPAMPTPQTSSPPPAGLEPDHAHEVATKMVEHDQEFMDFLWPDSVRKGETRKEILLPALEAEFAALRNQGLFVEMFRAVEADEVAEFIEVLRKREVESIKERLIKGHRLSILKATKLGLIAEQ